MLIKLNKINNYKEGCYRNFSETIYIIGIIEVVIICVKAKTYTSKIIIINNLKIKFLFS